MDLAKISELVFNREVLNPDKNHRVDRVVVGEDFSHDVGCDFVEDGQHACRLLGHPDGESRLFLRQVGEVYLDRLSVVLAHLLDSWFVDYLLRGFV